MRPTGCVPSFVINFLTLHNTLTDCSQCAGKLVGTRGGLLFAADTFETRDYIINAHAAYESRYPLSIAMAATIEAYVTDYSIGDFKLDAP